MAVPTVILVFPNGPTENLSVPSTLPLIIFPEYVVAVPEISKVIRSIVFQAVCNPFGLFGLITRFP